MNVTRDLRGVALLLTLSLWTILLGCSRPEQPAAQSTPAYPSADAPVAERLAAIQRTTNQTKAIAFLKTCLAAPETEVRIAALQHLAGFGDIIHLRAILDLYGDADPRVRLAALQAGWQLGTRGSLPWWEKARQDPEPTIRKEALLLIASTSEEEPGLLQLMAALDDPEPLIADAAQDALLQKGRKLVPFFQQLAVTATSAARVRMIKLIAALHDPELAPSLVWIEHTARGDQVVRDEVQRQLAALGPVAAEMITLATQPPPVGPGPGTTPQPNCNVTLRLEGFVQGKTLILSLECRDGRWPATAWGYTPNFNKGDHEFTVTSASRDNQLTRLEIDGAIASDPWIVGGPAGSTIEFGATNGTWRGHYRGEPTNGTVQVIVAPPMPVTRTVLPLRYQEHPRLGARNADWQPPTNWTYSAEANTALEAAMQPKTPARQAWGGPAIEMARAYDAMYWQASPSMRRYGTEAMLGMARGLLFAPSAQSTPWHNWQGQWRGGAGMAAIVALQDPSPFAMNPPAEEPVTTLAPSATIDANWPVNRLANKVLTGWLAGDKLLDPKHTPEGRLTMEAPNGTAVQLQSALQVRLPATVRVRLGMGTSAWLDDRKLKSDEVLALEPGTYSLRAEARVGLPFAANTLGPPEFIEIADPRLRRNNWRADFARWQISGGVSPLAARYVKLAEINCQRYLDWAIGEGGFTTEKEKYTLVTLNVMGPFLHALDGCLGRNLVAGGHADWLPLRAKAGSYNDHQGARFYDGKEILDLISPSARQALAARTPAEFPGHGIRDRQKAGYVFRNGWNGEAQDIFVTVEGKGQHLRGAHTSFDTGTFRLFGLGSAWAVYTDYSRDAPRVVHNVVLLPNDPVDGTLPAHELHYEVTPDGSGSVSLDMNDVFLGFGAERGPLVDFEGEPIRSSFRDLGIRAVRAVSADFTGKSGAPGVVIVADKITGGRLRVWQMHLAPNVTAQIDGASFTLRSKKTDATVRGTFVVPADVQLAADTTLTATGKSDFVVVMTLQRGEPPAITADSHTVPVAVTVGSQTYRFDGERITQQNK
jgi:hypothetical protein